MSLIAWFPLNNSTKNKGSGDFDLINTPAFTSPGKTFTQCAVNNSITSGKTYLTSQVLPLKNTDPISMFCWVYMDSYSTTSTTDALNGLISNHDHSAGGIGLTLRNTGSSFHVSFSAPTGTTLSNRVYSTIYSEKSFTVGSWHHVGVVYNGYNIKLYLDGELQTLYNSGTNTGLKYFTYTAGVNSANPIGIFCWSTSYPDYSSICKIQDARVYDRYLTDKEVGDLAKARVLHYSFEGTPTNLLKNSRNNYAYSGFNAAANSLTGTVDFTRLDSVFNNMGVNKFIPGTYNYGYVGPYTSINSMGASLVVGRVYTISIYLKADQLSTFSISGLYEGQTLIARSSDNTIEPGWKRYWATFKATATNFNSCIYASVNSSSVTSGYVYYCGWMLQEGYTYSDWTDSSYYINTIQDDTGNGNNGTLSVPSAYCLTTDTNLGLSALYTISGDPAARINTSLNPSFISDGTISFWYKKDSTAFDYNSGHFLVATQSSNGYYFGAMDVGLPFNNGCSYSAFYIDGEPASSGNVQDTAWHMYTFTGVNLSSWTSFSMHAHGDAAWLYRGCISDFRVYNTSLTANDIKALYKNLISFDINGTIYCKAISTTNGEIVSRTLLDVANNGGSLGCKPSSVALNISYTYSNSSISPIIPGGGITIT